MRQAGNSTDTGSKPPGFWERLHKRVGWIVGVIAPLAAPFFPTAINPPQGALLHFEFAGMLAGWLGFATSYYLWARTGIPRFALWLLMVATAFGSIYVVGKYLEFLWEIATPNRAEEWQMLALFAMTYFGAFLVAAFVYWAGGKFVLEKLARL